MELNPIKPRVLLVDDSERVVRAVSRILADEFDVIGYAHDGAEAIKSVIRLKPDVVVMDIVMPKLDGIQATRRLSQMNLPSKTVVLSGLEDQDFIEAAMAAGASGFVFKSCMVRDLSLAIHEALTGKVFVSNRS
jgi:DNA-binding NarL/FixJ family response regulator